MSLIKTNSWCLYFTASTKRSFTPCWQRDVTLWAIVSFKVWTDFFCPTSNNLFHFTDLSQFCTRYSIHPFVFLLWILLRRWRGGTGTKPSDGGLLNLWSCPGWFMPAVLIWSPKGTCMVRWRSACTPNRYNSYHKPELLQFLLFVIIIYFCFDVFPNRIY